MLTFLKVSSSVQSSFFQSMVSYLKKKNLSLYAHGLGPVCLVSLGCEGKLQNHEGMPMEEGGPCKHDTNRQRDRKSNPQTLSCETPRQNPLNITRTVCVFPFLISFCYNNAFIDLSICLYWALTRRTDNYPAQCCSYRFYGECKAVFSDSGTLFFFLLP